MPVSAEATALRWLGAVIPVPLPVRPGVASVGGLLVVAGLAQFLVTGMLPRRRHRPPAPLAAPLPAPRPPPPARPGGHVRLLAATEHRTGPARPRTEGDPLPRAGPT
jgi:hypothetical protein